MKTINIIGNNGSYRKISDGGRIKIRLFLDLLSKKGFQTQIIELDNWKFHFLRIIRQIRKAVKNKEDIIIMAGPNGCRFIIPLVLKFNKKNCSRIVFCPVGVGTLDKVIRKMSPEQVSDFLLNKNFGVLKDGKMSKRLSKLTYVVVENAVLKSCYESFYNINNVVVLQNFRVVGEEIPSHKIFSSNERLKCVFYSRVNEEKGALDLAQIVKKINIDTNKKIKLDFYGELQFKNNENFLKLMDEELSYKGVIDSNECYRLLSEYDLFILPTKYHGEGTPGSMVESLIVGTPVLISSYSQSKELVIDGYNGFVFRFNDKDDLYKVLLDLNEHKEKIIEVAKNVKESAKRFIFENIADDFYKYIGGIDE